MNTATAIVDTSPFTTETCQSYKARIDKLQIPPSKLSKTDWWTYMRGFGNLEGDSPDLPAANN